MNEEWNFPKINLDEEIQKTLDEQGIYIAILRHDSMGNSFVIDTTKHDERILKAVYESGWHCEIHGYEDLKEMVREELIKGDAEEVAEQLKENKHEH